MQAEVLPVLMPYVYKALVGIAVTGLGTLMLWPIRKAKAEWKGLKEQINSAQSELVQQRTNCLATLQEQGEKQIELLSKAANTLDAIHLGQVEMSGYIKAGLDRK